MKWLIFFILFIPIGNIYGELNSDADGCYSCHLEEDEDKTPEESVTAFINDDIHIKKGLTCVSCHGGNSDEFDDADEAMYDDDTFIGKPENIDQVELCGSCHSDPTYMRNYSAHIKTDQLSQYWTSYHGEKLKEGDDHVATCTSCHGVHGIWPVSDPRSTAYPTNVPGTCSKCHSNQEYMQKYNFPTDQYSKYEKSVHGVALLENDDMASPACNDCHGNHGALPPDVTAISDICGTCHINNTLLFKESPIGNVTINGGVIQCTNCHNIHEINKPTDEFLNWGEESVCIGCHENGGEAKELALGLYNAIDSLKTQIGQADSLLVLAENKGMDVEELYFEVEEAHRNLIQARTNIHTFMLEEVKKSIEPGIAAANNVKQGSISALGEYVYRRKGLFVFSLFLTMVGIGLILKIRQLEK